VTNCPKNVTKSSNLVAKWHPEFSRMLSDDVMKAYGIPNCNTVKKSLTWLKDHGLDVEFHDFKKKGITEDKLIQWCEKFGWENVLNKKGTTWRNLPAEEQQSVTDQASAIRLLLKNNSAIKRPIVEKNGVPVLLGFDETVYTTQLK
jgi:Spx/MgsR family transcriptional regulator